MVSSSVINITGCSNVSYLMQATGGQMEILSKAQPIPQIINDPSTKPALCKRLQYVEQVRTFASKQLALPDNGTFQRYCDLQRPYAVWNVFATKEFSMEPEQWCFPIAGCVSYRGYFSEQDAKSEAADLKQKKFDTYIGGIPTYSTLGWFDDPILSSFIDYSDPDLASIIFHELAHQIVYVPDDTAFNESFAVTVEEEGVRRWFNKMHDPAGFKQYKESKKRSEQLTNLILDSRDKLAALYDQPIPDKEKRLAKARIFDEMRQSYETLKTQWGGYDGYDHWMNAPFNNAKIATVSLYAENVPEFQALLAKLDDNLPRFYDAVKKLSKLPKEQRDAALAANLTKLTMDTNQEP